MKFHVHCSHPKASLHINGVDFVKVENGVRTPEPLEEEAARAFEGHRDFTLHEVKENAPKPAKLTKAEKAALEKAEEEKAAEEAAAEAGEEDDDESSEGDGGDENPAPAAAELF